MDPFEHISVAEVQPGLLLGVNLRVQVVSHLMTLSDQHGQQFSEHVVGDSTGTIILKTVNAPSSLLRPGQSIEVHIACPEIVSGQLRVAATTPHSKITASPVKVMACMEPNHSDVHFEYEELILDGRNQAGRSKVQGHVN